MKTLDLIFREVDRDKFERIVSGEKTIETRAGSPEYLSVAAGDTLNISCGNDSINKTVTEVFHFKTIEELLNTIEIGEILPAGTTREQAIELWNSFPGYPERIRQYGIIAWRLK